MIDSGWIKLHTPPKICRGIVFPESRSIKQEYYYQRSLQRYYETEDGQHMKKLSEKIRKNPIQEIGSLNSFRLIKSPEQ